MSDGDTPRSEDSLEDLIGAISDGSGVDWDRARSNAADDREREMVRELEIIASLSHGLDDDEAGTFQLSDGTTVPALWGSLRLEAPLGSGTFGTVFRARDLLLEHEVALKVLHPTRGGVVGRLIEEGRRLARLQHPGIVNVICVDEHEHLTGLRMGLVRGETLAEIVRARGPVPERRAIEIGLQLCDALAAVHTAGIVHRDVKARNVMQDEAGRVVLMDLGAGVESDDGSGSGSGGVGTPMYLAPELLSGGTATARSDVYGLGVLLYHVTTGEYPYDASTVPDLERALANDASIPLRARRPDLSDGFADAVARAMMADPDQRISSVTAMSNLLKDLTTTPEGEPSDDGPSPNNLPALLTRFVGREKTLVDARALVRAHRVVTFTGAGGCGKTRTSLELAWTLLDEFPHGTWLIELAPIDRPALVTQTVMDVIGVPERPTVTQIDTLISALARKRVLLVLDNCEHMTDACAELVSAITSRAPGVHVLATSREGLRVPGEVICPIVPLGLPDPDVETSPEALREVESVRLFTERARATDHSFDVTAENGPALARIVRRLDGIPLALELAAVQVAVFSLEEIAARLEDRFLSLGADDSSRLPHQRTLSTLVGWSYELLTAPERSLARRASIFRGGWTLEAADAVCTIEGLDARDLPALHFQLVTKSLVIREPVADPVSGSARYRMLETIREFVAEQAMEHPEDAPARDRHRRYYLELTNEAQQRGGGKDQPAWLARLDSERGNLRVALRANQDEGDIESALRMAWNLGPYWEMRARWHESREIYRTLLDHPRAASHRQLLAGVMNWAGNLAAVQGDRGEAHELVARSLIIRRELGEPQSLAQNLNDLGVLSMDRGDYDEARGYFEESLAKRRELGRTKGVIQSLMNLGELAFAQDELRIAREYEEEALRQGREIEFNFVIAYALRYLAQIAVREQRYEEAGTLLQEAVDKLDELGERWLRAVCEGELGYLSWCRGDAADARARIEKALADQLELGDVRSSPDGLANLAFIELASSDTIRAARLLAAATRRRSDAGIVPAPFQANEEAVARERLRVELGEETLRREWTIGETTPVEVLLSIEPETTTEP